MKENQKFKLYKVFKRGDLPEEMQEYIGEGREDCTGLHWYFCVSLAPDRETGNGHIPLAKWLVEHGAAKGEIIIISTGDNE